LRNSSAYVAGLVSAKHSGPVIEVMTSGVNNFDKMPSFLKDLFAEVVGLTDQNKGVYKLVNVVKYMVSATRQDYREKLPVIFAKQFSRKLTKSEWSALHLVMGKTDLAALAEIYSAEDIRGILSDERELKGALEAALADMGVHARMPVIAHQRKADELARYMATGEIDSRNHNLLKNARAVSFLLNEHGAKTLMKAGVNKPLVAAIDRYVTLKALSLTDQAQRDLVRELARKEPGGSDFLYFSLVDLRNKEMARGVGTAAELNGWKGYIPSEAKEGATLLVAKESEHTTRRHLGYTKLGDYKGSGLTSGKESYFYSTVGGSSTYVQGVMQTVQSTAMGVDPRTGRNMQQTTGRAIIGEELRDLLEELRQNPGSGIAEALIPVVDSQGNIMAMEPAMSPEMLSKLNRSTHIGNMMGAWAGRQSEEGLSQAYNQFLIDALKADWEKGIKTGKTSEFVDLSDKSIKDQVWKDAWSIMPTSMRKAVRATFGDAGFMVRKNMVNQAMGYRMPSVRDAWAGPSRVDPTVRKATRDAVTFILGINALPWLLTGEKFWQAGISVAKQSIVIRSVVVPMSNIASNVQQLMVLGV